MDKSANLFTVVMSLVGLLQTIALAVIWRLNNKSGTQGETLVRLETILTGATGDNGLVGDVTKLKNDVLNIQLDRRGNEPGRRLVDYIHPEAL